MSSSSRGYDVGCRLPAEQARWKKGQSGDPSGRRPARAISALEMIDELLLSPVDVVKNGVIRKATALEAIIIQLWQKELGGNERALAARMKFEGLARTVVERGFEIEFADSDYTRALAAGRSTDGTRDE